MLNMLILLQAAAAAGPDRGYGLIGAGLAAGLAVVGAGLGIGSLRWIIPVQIGAYLGYLTFGFIADRLGRRPTFVLFMVSAAALVLLYGQMAARPGVLMLLGPVLGYFGHGYFSMFGSFVAELFPAAVSVSSSSCLPPTRTARSGYSSGENPDSSAVSA